MGEGTGGPHEKGVCLFHGNPGVGFARKPRCSITITRKKPCGRLRRKRLTAPTAIYIHLSAQRVCKKEAPSLAGRAASAAGEGWGGGAPANTPLKYKTTSEQPHPTLSIYIYIHLSAQRVCKTGSEETAHKYENMNKSPNCRRTAPSPVGEGWGGGSKPPAARQNPNNHAQPFTYTNPATLYVNLPLTYNRRTT